jgi:outer membrane protein assembly factor BamB
VLVAGGKLLILSESGELLLAQPDSKQFRPLGKVQVNRKPCWAPPSLSNGLLYTRNNDGKVSCFDLR